MTRFWLLTVPLMLLLGCVSPRPQPSVWQRYDALRGALRGVTYDAEALAREQRSAATRVRHGNVALTKRAAVRLKACANRLSRQAGNVGNTVRGLASQVRSGPGKRYLGLVLRALESQWLEGRYVAAMTDVLWSDPQLMSPRNLARLQRTEWAARQSARRAVEAARAAATLSRKDRAAFRYVPVSVRAGS